VFATIREIYFTFRHFIRAMELKSLCVSPSRLGARRLGKERYLEERAGMRSHRIFICLVLAISLVGVAQGQEHETAAEAAVRAADAAWEKAYSAKRLDRAVVFFDDKASLLWPNMPVVTGKVAIRDAVAKDFASGDLTWHSNEVGAAHSGDLAYTSGTYRSAFKSGSGKASVDRGKYLTIWKKQADNSWKVLFDTFNSDLPALP
jgi:ketosteroid isomerase-like protein